MAAEKSAEIVAVYTVEVSSITGGNRHEHIAGVKTADGRELSRVQAVVDILNGEEEYFTEALDRVAGVSVVSCPRCAAEPWYLTTHPDDTTKNNLLSLPRFTPLTPLR